MSKVTVVLRTLMGLMFVFAGITGLFNLVPAPPDLPENLQAFNTGLAASTYFFPLLKITETICGILLLTGLYVPLALVVLAPIVLNIFFTHLFMAPSGLPLAAVLGIILIYLSFFARPYSRVIRGLFVKRP